MNRFSLNANNYQSSPIHCDDSTSRKIKKLILVSKNSCIADLGCGPGHFSLQLAKKNSRIYFIDKSKEMLELAKKNVAEKKIQFQAIQSDVNSLPSSDSSIDLVVSRLAFHHFEKWNEVVDQAYRILKPGGFFILCDLEAPPDPIANEISHAIEVLHDPSHIKCLESTKLTQGLNHHKWELHYLESFRKESKKGITLNQWFEIADTSVKNRQQIKNLLQCQASWILEQLKIKKVNQDFILYLRTFLLILRKKKGHV